MKSQNVRVLDVLVLGPFTIWAGMQKNKLPDAARAGLVIYGAGTIIYNAKNYAKINREAKKRKELQGED